MAIIDHSTESMGKECALYGNFHRTSMSDLISLDHKCCQYVQNWSPVENPLPKHTIWLVPNIIGHSVSSAAAFPSPCPELETQHGQQLIRLRSSQHEKMAGGVGQVLVKVWPWRKSGGILMWPSVAWPIKCYVKILLMKKHEKLDQTANTWPRGQACHPGAIRCADVVE